MLGRSQSPVICVALAEQHRHSHADSSHLMLQDKQPALRQTLLKSLLTDHSGRKTSPRETGASVQRSVYSSSWDFKKNSSLKNTRVSQEREKSPHTEQLQLRNTSQGHFWLCSPPLYPGAVLVTHLNSKEFYERIQYLKQKSNLMGHT